MENVRTRCDLFSLGTGSTPVMAEITSRRFEIYHIKTYVMLERVNERIKEIQAAALQRSFVRVFFKTVFVLIHTST